MPFKRCRGCPQRAECARLYYAQELPYCEAGRKIRLEAEARQREHAQQPQSDDLSHALPTSLQPPPDARPLTLREAAAIVVRHWDQLGADGMDAAITLLRRVLDRTERRA